MQPKIGSRFKLGNWVWRVERVDENYFISKTDSKFDEYSTLIWPIEHTHALDWLPEPATISKEARDEIVEWTEGIAWTPETIFTLLEEKLDSMTKETL